MMGGTELRTTLIAIGCALTLAACADDPRSAPTSTTPSATTSDPSPSATPAAAEERWIAVIDVAPDPNDLDDLTQRLLDPLGTALVVAPVDCFEGLPEPARDGYLIGAVGDTRTDVERRVVDAGEEVAFTAKVTILCID